MNFAIGKPTVILGAGAFARELWGWLLQQEINVVAFFDDSSQQAPKTIYHVPVVNDLAPFKGTLFITGTGDPKSKIIMVNKAMNAGLIETPYYMHESVVTGVYNRFKAGSIFCPNVVVTCNTDFGNHVTVNLNSTVGHDCSIGDFVTIAPGVNISGRVSIGGGTYIGSNAVIKEGVHIGQAVTIGAGAVVVKDVPDTHTVVGNPARQLLRAPLKVLPHTPKERG